MTVQQKAMLQRLGPTIALVVVCIVLVCMSRNFLTVSNSFDVIRQVSINAVIAFGMTKRSPTIGCAQYVVDHRQAWRADVPRNPDFFDPVAGHVGLCSLVLRWTALSRVRYESLP